MHTYINSELLRVAVTLLPIFPDPHLTERITDQLQLGCSQGTSAFHSADAPIPSDAQAGVSNAIFVLLRTNLRAQIGT
jgi:hypothetical protein